MRADYEVNCFPRPYGVAAYAVGYNLGGLKLPEDQLITFPRNSNWADLTARRIGGFRSMGEVRQWCREHRYPMPETPCIPLIVGFGQPIPGTEGME